MLKPRQFVSFSTRNASYRTLSARTSSLAKVENPTLTRSTTIQARRAASTSSYVPPDSLKDIRAPPPSTTPLPTERTFFTAKASYYTTLYSLQDKLNGFTSELNKACVLPLPKAATHHIGPVPSYWRDITGMEQVVGKGIRESQYRSLIEVLTQLNRIKRIAELASTSTSSTSSPTTTPTVHNQTVYNISKQIGETIAPFERGDKGLLLARGGGRKKPVPDEYGRVYALGRRKTSSARVWVIPSQQPSSSLEPVQPAQVLVNGLPLATYFTHSEDRERALRPLKVTGLLASYNVFCLARGGGTMGQAEALALGLSKALQVLEPGIEPILKAGKMLRRDPRMVERKKTNLAKARKAYTWVKR